MKIKKTSIELTWNELMLLEVAVRLRAEACEENEKIPEEKKNAAIWRKLLAKLEENEMMRVLL